MTFFKEQKMKIETDISFDVCLDNLMEYAGVPHDLPTRIAVCRVLRALGLATQEKMTHFGRGGKSSPTDAFRALRQLRKLNFNKARKGK
jgi:hypothetical protein